MDRRSFFRRAAGKAAETVVKEADRKVKAEASRWIRPPYAIDELEFLLACTRCGECISACPHDVVFPLTARLGAKVVNTPAMDILNKGCHCCEDWPCVAVCEPGALAITEAEEEETPVAYPVMAKAKVDTEHCLPYSGPECGACRGICPVPDAMTWERERPVIQADVCIGCGMCREVCIVEPKAIKIVSINKQVEV